MKCNVCQKKTENENYVLGWAVLCSQECLDILFKESNNDVGCKSCEDKCPIEKKSKI
ncbi:MAG: hypothetical protein KFW07_00825 [Mycoplasmataceae bacterium]|nr:hypothetical protein [Mycoplasmataceae bacterium]